MSKYPEEPAPTYVGGSNGSDTDEKARQNSIKEQGFIDFTHDPEAPAPLKRDLKGRHMQMIAIGGAIGAGLFVQSGGALSTGGPAPLIICFLIIGIMLYFVMQALAELGVMYPVNGAFFTYACRFVDPSWGFAMGWDYAVQWLTVLPFEITAAGITLQFWKASANINIGVWITVFLVALTIVQVFGIRGYGEVEFFLSMIKICAVVGFIIFAIILNVGGIPGGPGYIGVRYWHSPYSAFKNGFRGFCGIFVTASFAYAGTELTGLAAAEAADPLKSIPTATKQVLWRILIFYVVALLMIGLVVPANADYLLQATGAHTKYSPFVGAIASANVPILPSLFNGVITLSVLSVANSCAFGSTRTLQALAACGMAPKFLAKVDKKGRPIWCVVLQLCFGLLAYINEAPDDAGFTFFYWLLAFSGIANFFVWGTICVSHIRFRKAWKYNGRDKDEIPYQAQCGVIGSWIGLALNVIVIMATFYTSVWPMQDTASAEAYTFFQDFLAAPFILVLYLFWKIWTRNWRLLIPISEIDIDSGQRLNIDQLREMAAARRVPKTWATLPKRFLHAVI